MFIAVLKNPGGESTPVFDTSARSNGDAARVALLHLSPAATDGFTLLANERDQRDKGDV